MRNGADCFGLSLSEVQLSQFITYLYEIKRWNRVHRLTSIEGPREIVFSHFLDSLTPVKFLKNWNDLKVLDIGSGAGLPGIPLKIAFPEMVLSLLEAREKKAAFLHQLLGVLGLKGVEVLNQRLESLGLTSTRRNFFDRILSRGVGMSEAIMNHWEKLIENKGEMVVFGGNPEVFLKDQSLWVEKNTVSILGSQRTRTLFVIRKGMELPAR